MNEDLATRPHSYDMETVVEALTILVKYRGNLTAATAETGVAYGTLRQWSQVDYADRYVEIESQYGQELEQQIVMEARSVAHKAALATHEAIDATLEEIRNGNLSGRELAGATLSLARTMSMNVDKVLALTGRPTNPGKGSAADAIGIIRELQAAGVLHVDNQAVDATAVDDDANPE